MGATVRLVCWSDTHNQHAKVRLPDGDVLVHAGDLTGHGDLPQIRAFADHLGSRAPTGSLDAIDGRGGA